MTRAQRSGFTLIELMIVIGIIGILVAVLIGVLLAAAAKGDLRRAQNFVENAVPDAMQKWQEEEGKKSNQYPNSGRNRSEEYIDGNRRLYKALVTDSRKPLIDSSSYTDDPARGVFLDPWNNPYVYRNWGSPKPKSGRVRGKSSAAKAYNDKYDLISAGPDGDFGTDDDIRNGE